MNIHYLQHVSFETPESVITWALSQEHKISSTRFHKNEILPKAEDIDCLLIMGGPMGANDDALYPWLKQEKKFIEEAILKNKIVVGICLGAQLIANVLGTKVYKNPYKEIGWFPIHFTPDAKKISYFSSFPEKLDVFHWHGDTFDLPHNAVHIAKSEACTNQAFLYGDKILGLQFHLEVSEALIEKLIVNCSTELIPDKFVQSTVNIYNGKKNASINNIYLNNIFKKLEEYYETKNEFQQ